MQQLPVCALEHPFHVLERHAFGVALQVRPKAKRYDARLLGPIWLILLILLTDSSETARIDMADTADAHRLILTHAIT